VAHALYSIGKLVTVSIVTYLTYRLNVAKWAVETILLALS